MTSASAASDSTAPQAVGFLAATSIDCSDPAALAEFYGPLLGMRPMYTAPDGSIIAISDGRAILSLMRSDDHVETSWPHPGQSMQMHLDVSVTDLPAAVETAVRLGAREAEKRANPELFRVLIDPAGHPFCLTTFTPD